MDPEFDSLTGSGASLRTYAEGDLVATLGPAEAQYGEALVLGLEGDQGALACGTTVTAGDPNDLDPAQGVAANAVWNAVPGATSYRVQRDLGSATFVTEDTFAENYAFTSITFGSITPGSDDLAAIRVIAHVGHVGGHGATPIAGDVVSNDCALRLIYPED